jgi:single-stranded-DNA-specific exonuclease
MNTIHKGYIMASPRQYKVNDDVYSKCLAVKLNPLESLLFANRLTENAVEVARPTKQLLDKYIHLDSQTKEAAVLLKKNVEARKHIVLITDSDCDGISSAAIGYLYFELAHNMEVSVIINKREYGNGVNDVLVDKLLDIHHNEPVSLVITADHGSSDEIRYKRIKDHTDIDIIVTDHHLYKEKPTSIDYFINPQDPYSKLNKCFSGCHVLYMLFRELSGVDDELDYLLPIVAMSTIVDQMDMRIPVNRYIVKRGLETLHLSKPFQTYIEKNTKTNTNSSDIFSMGLGPMINSTNRMNHPEAGFAYLTQDDTESNYKILAKINKRRKKVVTNYNAEIDRYMLIDKATYNNSRVVRISGGEGIAGIIASRLVDREKIPSIVFIEKNHKLHGSGRSPGTVHLNKFIKTLEEKDLLIKGGGHKFAAGLVIPSNKFNKFRDAFEEFSTTHLEELFIDYDFKLPLKSYVPKILETSNNLEPTGNSFSKPRFLSKEKILRINTYGSGYTRYVFDTGNGTSVQGFSFTSFGDIFDDDTIELVYEPITTEEIRVIYAKISE